MLAYVFWHWPRPDVDGGVYEDALSRFHDALAGAAPAGMLGSAAFRVNPAPFASAGARPYEDWYLLSDSAALDALDAEAVGPTCDAAHGAVASLSAGSTAGLYRLVGGSDEITACTTAEWCDVPSGAARQAVVDALSDGAARSTGAGLWMRRMTLGPAPELCLLERSPTGSGLPAGALGQDRLRIC